MSNVHESDSTPPTTVQLKEEIDTLFELQNESLRRTTFLGMTSDEAKVMEQRRKKITALVDQLAQLKTAE